MGDGAGRTENHIIDGNSAGMVVEGDVEDDRPHQSDRAELYGDVVAAVVVEDVGIGVGKEM